MSRIGKKPVIIPNGVTVTVDAHAITAKGPKGELSIGTHPEVTVAIEDGQAVISVKDETVKQQKALWGLFRSLVQNLVLGVTTGFSKQLEINGVGYKIAVQGNDLNMALGYSHPVIVPIPKGLAVTVEKNVMTISGASKQQVGQFAAEVRDLRPVEPYKGKGFKYVGEVVRRKAGKAAKSAK